MGETCHGFRGLEVRFVWSLLGVAVCGGWPGFLGVCVEETA